MTVSQGPLPSSLPRRKAIKTCDLKLQRTELVLYMHIQISPNTIWMGLIVYECVQYRPHT